VTKPDNNSNPSANGGYLGLYGLTREPFIGEMSPSLFYLGATREQRLNLLLHLIPLGEILLITGVPGIGKTTLLEQFLARGKESWRVCRLDASAGLDSNQLLQQLVQAFAPEVAGQADRSERERLLIAQLQLLRKNAQQPMLLIDNAQHMPESGFRALSKIILDAPEEERLFGAVLFSEPEIEEKLNNPALQALRGQIKHTFELPRLSEEETLQYLDHRIQAAGLQGSSPFTAAVNKAIFGASKGLPLKINELAQAVMQNKQHVASPQPTATAEAGKDRVDKPRKIKLPRISLAIVWPFVIAALLASILVFQDDVNSLFNPPDEQVEVSAAKEVNEPLATVERALTQTEEAETLVAAVQEQPNLLESNSAAVIAEVGRQETEVETAVETPAAVEKADVIDPSIIEPEAPALPVPELIDAVPEQATAQKAPVEAAEPSVPKRDWVMDQPPQAYTLQIVAQEKLQKREAFIARFELENDVERFSTNKKGVRWYVAAVGVYGSRTEALEASRQLPEGVVPWVRSFASIQKELWRDNFAQGVVNRGENDEAKSSSPDEQVAPPGLTPQEHWVLARSPDHYVLQLAAFEKEAKTRGFIESHQLQDSGKLVRLINKGQLWYVAIYGDVADRAEALLLADDLENSKGVSRPWVRSFGSLQHAVQKIQQK
jgi:DamX protein